MAAITTVMNAIILNEAGDERIVTHHSPGDLHAASISGSAPKIGCASRFAHTGHCLLLLIIPANINRPPKTQWLIYASVGQDTCFEVFENTGLGGITRILRRLGNWKGFGGRGDNEQRLYIYGLFNDSFNSLA